MFLLDTLLPVRCAACGTVAPRGLCAPCASAAEWLRLPAPAMEVLAPGIATVGVFAYDGVVRDAVRGMKLGGRHGAARPLAALIEQSAGPAAAWTRTWVPSTADKLRHRGFELPRSLAGPRAVPLLARVLDRPDQTELTATQRRAFPQGAFAASGDVPREVVLVDDVRTTGATATSAAGALRAAGAHRVLVVTFAVGGDAARAAQVAGAESTTSTTPRIP